MKDSRDVLIFNFTYEHHNDPTSEISHLNIITFSFDTPTNEYISVKKEELGNFLSDSQGLIVALTKSGTVFSTKALDDYHLRELIKEKPESINVLDEKEYATLVDVNLNKFANVKGFFKHTFHDGFDYVQLKGDVSINEHSSSFDEHNEVHQLFYWETQLREAYKQNLNKKWFIETVRDFPKKPAQEKQETKYQVVYVDEYGEVKTSRLFNTEAQAKNAAKRHNKKLCIVSFSYTNPF